MAPSSQWVLLSVLISYLFWCPAKLAEILLLVNLQLTEFGQEGWSRRLSLLRSKLSSFLRSFLKQMSRRLTLRKRRNILSLAVSVIGCGFFVASTFILENISLLVPFMGISLCGVLGWVSITRENRIRENVASGTCIEIVGKPGIVVEECSPVGRVRIGDVTWSAISHDGITLRVGERITVQNMQELKLTVKAKAPEISAHH
jgi:membrane protein implicated in regulation of membrane protease activity